MEARKVGGSGLAVSVVGLGCNNFGMRIGPDETQSVVDAALDAGITFFDTAEMYGGGKSEEFLGAALGKSANREDVIIASKFGRPEMVEEDERPDHARPHRGQGSSHGETVAEIGRARDDDVGERRAGIGVACRRVLAGKEAHAVLQGRAGVRHQSGGSRRRAQLEGLRAVAIYR